MKAALQKHWASVVGVAILAVIAGVLIVTHKRWLPIALEKLSHDSHDADDHHHHSESDKLSHGHDHNHGHEEVNSVELSQAAQKNIGLKLGRVELQTFVRTISVPGIVAERPGRSQMDITAPMTGIVTKVFTIEGEAVVTDQPLFEIRLTHEELVASQRDFLRLAEELEVVKREVKRLEIAGEGTVAGKVILERKFEQQKLEAALHAQQQGLLLHGLSAEQVQTILDTRRLLQTLTVQAPEHEDSAEKCAMEHSFHIHKLNVKQGQHVEAGSNLCNIADHCELFIEGTAFEHDLAHLNRAASEGWDLVAVLTDDSKKKISGLKILYLKNEIEEQSRALHFYVALPNQVVRDSKINSHRFIVWQFRPGQRMQLQIPVENWPDRIVLPADAVAQDGPETYVFMPNGDHFDRRPVHVEYRDPFSVVIANDGAIFPGDVVALSSAQQLQLALKNKSGGGIDPHAGHQH